MLNSADIVCFAATKNPEAAKKFYEEVLGLSLIEDQSVRLSLRCQRTMLRIQKVQEHTPAKHTTLGLGRLETFVRISTP